MRYYAQAICYGAHTTRSARMASTALLGPSIRPRYCLCACYAVSGTDLCACIAVSGTQIACGPTRNYRAYACYGGPGYRAYGSAMRLPVLSKRLRLLYQTVTANNRTEQRLSLNRTGPTSYSPIRPNQIQENTHISAQFVPRMRFLVFDFGL
eukprot:2377843-Rhodomonas_salina.4